MQASADPEISPSPCSRAEQKELPPPYTPTPALSSPYPPPYPHHPPQPCRPEEAGFTASYQHDTLRTPVIEENLPSFDDKSIRRAFIRKVFCMVTLQLLFTFSVVCLFSYCDALREAVKGNVWVFISSCIVYVVVSLLLLLCWSFSRHHPWNLVGLSLVTLSLSYMIATVASTFNPSAVIIAMGSTVFISFAIVIFSVQSKLDFTVCNGIVLVLVTDLLMFGVFSIFFYSTMSIVFYGCAGALLFSLFLAVDCQLILGRDSYSLSPEDYVFATLIIYLDMINIFLYILLLVGGSSSN